MRFYPFDSSFLDVSLDLLEKLQCFFFSELGHHLRPKGGVPNLLLEVFGQLLLEPRRRYAGSNKVESLFVLPRLTRYDRRLPFGAALRFNFSLFSHRIFSFFRWIAGKPCLSRRTYLLFSLSCLLELKAGYSIHREKTVEQRHRIKKGIE